MIALEVKNLNKRYMFVKALNDFSVTFEKGKIIGLLGPNGSGKTTLMRILSGLLQKTSGEIRFETKLKGKLLKQTVAYMPTESHLYPWMKVKQTINFYESFFAGFDRSKVLKAIEVLDLSPNATIKSLSTGQRGRLKVALTLARKAELYLIDEPLNGIDPISRDMILEMLASEVADDKCIVISSHLVHEFEKIVDDVIFIRKGRLELMGDAETLRNERQMSIHDLYKEVYKND
ncbi:MAG: ABC transporter ATP-binding protein [Clostridia bacterium]|nr:ABC transporter ATP-binding protein [Clostridia bacterium]